MKGDFNARQNETRLTYRKTIQRTERKNRSSDPRQNYVEKILGCEEGIHKYGKIERNRCGGTTSRIESTQ